MADLNKIYNALREKGVVTKSYEEFANAMADGNKRKNVYNALAQQGLITKSYKQFSDAVAPSHAPQTTQSTSTAPRNNDWVKQGLSVLKGVPSMPTPNIPSYRPTPLKPSEQNFDEIIANGFVYKDDNTYNSVVSGLDERIKQAQQQYDALLKQHSQNVKKGRKEASFWERLGAMPDVDDVPTKTSDDVLTPESDQLRAARETLHRLQNTRVQLERGRESKTQGEELDKRKKNGSGLLERAAYKTAISLENFGKGFMDALRGSDMWATNDAANDLMAVKNIVHKVDKWNALTDKEKSAMTSDDLLKVKPTDEELEILNNYALAYNVNAQAQDPISSNWSYKAGGVSANSALFGIEMAASGGMNVSSSAGRAIEKGALKLSQKAVKNGLEKLVGKTFEKSLARKIAGGVGQLPVQFGMGALESTVLQNGLTERKAQEYEIGTPLMSMDENGALRYSGSLGKLDAKGAHNRALVEQTIENQTEMLGGQIGEVLGGLTKVGVKVLNKMKLGENITKLMTDVSSNQFNRIMNNALNTAGYNGFLGEYLEEHAGDVEQALFLGTMTFDTDPETGIYNKEHILETMSGLAPMMGGHMVMEGTSYGASRARMAMMLSMAERKGSKLFGDERWAQVKQSLGGLDNQQFADKLSSMLQDKTLSDKQKKAVYNYAFYEKARQGFELMSLKQDMEGAVSLIDKNSRTNFVIGYKKGGQAAGELLTNLQKAQRNLRVRLGDYGYRQLFEENGDDFNKAYNSGMLDTDQKKQAYLDYVNALSCYQGALQRLHNDKKSELVNAKTDVDNIMDEQGNIVSATTTDGKKVNIVNGNVVLNEDGSVNVEKSGSLVVVDSDGKRKMISASEVASVDSVTKASDVLAQKNKEIVDKYATEEMSQKIQVGAQLPILTPNGSVIATIVSVNEDGSVSFKMGDSENIITTDAYNLYVMNLNAEVSSALREDDDAEQSTESVPEVATEGERPLTDVPSPAEESREYAQGDVFDVVVDGNKMHAEIVSPKDADGRFVVNVDDGESMRTLYVTPEELAAMEYREEPSTKAEETRLATEDSSDKALERGAQPTEEHAPTALERIPRDEKGNAQFHDVDTETAWDGLVEMSGNEETAHKVAEASLANAEKRLKAAKALKEKGETPEELLRSIKENEAAVAEAQRVVDAWKAIVGEKASREEAAKAEAERIATEKAEAERKAAEERERAEKEEKTRIEAEKKEAERIAAEKAEEEARVEAERKAEEERIAKQKAEEKTAEAESDKEEAEKRMDDEEPKPLGSGVFGNIYNQFKGKVKEAFDFLMKHKGGDLLGVFHRKDVGDIDLVWGDHGGGLAHIIRRHIIEQNDFKNVDEIQKVIEDVIRNGLIVRENKDKINIEYNGYRVSIKKTIRDSKGNVVENKNWIVTAFDKSKPKHEKRNPSSSETLTTPSANQKADGVTLPSNEDSIDKGSKKAEKKQKKQSVFDKAKEITDKEEKKRKAEAEDDSVLGQAARAVGKKKKVNLFKYTASQKDAGEVMKGVHYANGYAYASDGYILFKEKADYPKEWEGTTRDKDGNLIDGKYPDTEKAIHRLVHIPDKEVESLPSKEVLDFAIAASKKLKGEAIPVAIDGLFFNAVNLKKFLEAVASKGMDKVVYRHPMLYATNGKDEIVMMPTVNTLEGTLDIADKMERAGLPKEQIDAWKAHIEAADKKMSFEDFQNAEKNAKRKGVRLTEAESPKRKADERYQRGEGGVKPSKAEVALRDAVIDRLRESGMDVIADEAEGQRVLDEVNGRAKVQMGDAPETFAERQKQAVESHGVVMPGLNESYVEVVKDIPRHEYTGSIAEATREAIDAAKRKYAGKELTYNNYGANFNYTISANAIDICLSPKHQNLSANKGIHLALAEHLDEVINKSVEVEEHPDYIKGKDGKRGEEVNPNAIMHRFYGVAVIDGTPCRVMTLMREDGRSEEANGVHSYEVQKIEVLDNESPSTSNGVGTQMKDLSAYPLAKLLKGVEKSYDKGKYLLDESKKRSVGLREQRVDGADGVRFFRTANGEAYGFTVGGRIYIDPRIATSETPVHEYAHLWAEALRNGNPKEWQNVVELMKGTKVWDEVKARYPELKSDDEIADEVIATYSGRRGAERLREEQRKIAEGNGGVFEKAEAVNALERVKQALKKFWNGVADFLHIHYKSAEEVADRVMKDLLEGVDPRKMGKTKDGGVRFSAKQKRALETASLGNVPRSLTVVSSAAGANVLNNIENLAKEFEKSATQPKTFIGDVAKALGASRFGSGSEYATFETKNGNIVTIRLANHNAHVSGFDHNDKDNGISIVISPKPNEGITNDGNAHITEFYYDSIKLRRAEGKPLAEIVRSIKQALYSGEFKDTTGLAERQEVNGEDVIRYQSSSENSDKTLAGVHNITEEKLRKALKLGGLANPSVAVIDISKNSHEGFGEISLILPSEKVAKRTGKNAGTWQGDAWTPTYPQIERRMSNKGAEKASKDVLSVPSDMYSEVRIGLDRWLDSGEANSAMAYMFLHEKGVAPEPKKIQPKFSDEAYNELKSITAGNFNIYGISKADAQKVLAMYIDAYFDGDKDLYEDKTKAWLEKNRSIVDAGDKGGMRYAIAKENVKLYDEYGFNYRGVQTFVRDVEYDHRNTGVDMNATLNEVEDYIKTNSLTDEFNTWQEGKEKEYGIKEVIFDGFTPSGNRRYIPNTLENVSKIMKKQGRNGATGAWASFPNFAARLMPSYGTLEDIRSKKGLLTSDREKIDDFREKWSKVFFELGMKCQPDATGTFDDYGFDRLSEAAMTSDPQAFLKQEYNVDFSDEDTKRLKKMVKAIKEEYPAMYFETKFERPVYLNEFAAVVVPNDLGADVKKALSDLGIAMYEYDASKEGDRSRAFDEAVKSSGKIRFQFIGEKGAAEADHAEEVFANENVERSVRESRSEKTDLTAEERELRDNLVERMRKGGLDVVTDSEEMQRVIDRLNGRGRLSGRQKSALETATIAAEATNNATVISSADGAKIQNNLGTLATNYEKIANKTRGFITDLSQALGLKRHESSQYGTFETPDGKRITIRVSNHNARVSNFDKNNESDGISIVISSHKNKGLLNDGNAHIIEYFYPKRALENAEGKPLAEMIRSVSDALAGEEFKDTTGLAEREEVNGSSVREHRVYHGSGADFDAFDHSHMGEGEGAQAYGWGTYVTEVEGIGRTYAIQNTTKHNDALRALQHDVDAISDQLNRHRDDLKYDEEQLKRANEWRAEAELDYELFRDEAEKLKEKYGESSPEYRNHLFNDIYTDEMKRAQSSVKSTEESIQYRKEKIAELEKALKDKQAEIDELPKEFPRHLYTVEIPDDNGSNYLDWNGHPAESLLKDVGSFLESEGFERVQDNPVRYEKGESTVVLNPNATGADLYAELREALGSDKKASQALAELGCIGIKYPADNMRGGRKDGAKNYVIFNENDAKITDHTRFLRTADGEVYGLVKDGRIYLDPKVATAETAVHEYTHLWGDMLRRKDSEQWSHTVKELKNSVIWEEVKELYPELKTDDEIADEVLSTFSGRRGAERLREEARRVADGEGGVFTKAKAIETLERVKEAIARFWEGVARMFGINRYRSAEELADMAMKDLLDGVDPRKMGNNEKGIGFSAKQKRALETVTMADKSTNKATAISSADGAKVQNNLEILAESYNNRSNKTKGFITDLSQALNLERHEASHYGTFETQKGKLVTIRVSNHNARVSLFDKNGENDGISIVISNHKNKGLLNDGNAHIIEFFYSKQSLQRADGKPLSDIIRSVSEVLYSGEFKDTTGLAERQEVNGDDVIRFQFIGEKGAAEADHAEEVFANENVERSVRENPKSEEPRFSRKPGESIFDYASRVSEDGLLFRDGGTEYDFPGEDDAQKLYNAAVDGRKSRAIESWQDEMFPVKMLQEAIEKATGEKIADFENAYLLENQLGSAGNATLEKYAREVQNPMRKVYLDMLKAKFDGGSKVTKSDINKYVIAVHGLERNKYMADKNKGLPDARRDYSGFTALFGNGEQVEVEELERRAEEYIGKFEDAVGKDKADKLWSLVDESRQRTLDELVRSGLVSGDVADEWLRRFEHYVPLQGFSEEVIGEDRNANFENHITGRMSEARDPLATLVNMEYVAVTSGNHNRVKQALYNLALNHRTNLLSVMPMFSVKNPITGEWEDAVPQIDETMSPIERQREVDKFIKQMRVRMREEKDLPESDKTVKDARKVSVGSKVLPKAMPDFIVRMKVNGRQYAVVLNGNPRAAQAINGRLKEHPNKALQKISGVTRFMSAAVTAWNAAFMLSNFARDVQAANAFAYSNEGAKYAAMMDAEIHKNMSLTSLGRDLFGMKNKGIYKLYYKYRHNQLDMSNERERFFKEFVDNGGETGYTQMVDIDKIAKQMQKDEFSAIKAIKSVGKFIELANKGFENATRFAAYATSRKMGKSVMQSINDAKEISVNFNRHGNGRNGYVIAKSLYQFLNPTIQGLEKQLRTIKEHPLEGTAVLIATPIAIGFAIPLVNIGLAMLSGGGDDDKKYYWSLSDWTRRNNLIIGVNGKFIKIPLPPELRVFYGIGEMIASKMSNPYDKTNLLTEIPKHISETLPFNDTNSTFPSFVKPFIESEVTDKDFMGRKITGRSDYNTQDPEWKRAGYNTDDEYIAAAKWWHSLFTDNDNERGSWFAEINPSVAEHLIKGYTGGIGSIVGQVYTTVKAIAKGNEKDYSDSRNWPIVNRVYVQTTKEDAVKKTTNTAYRFYQDNYKNYEHTFKETLKDEKSGIFQKAQRISNMVETSEYKRYRMTEPFIKADKLLWDEIKALKETDDKESLEWIEKEQTRLRSVLVEASEKFDIYDNAGLTYKLDRMSKPGAYKSDLKIDVKSAPNKDMRKFAKEYNVKIGKYKQQTYKDEQEIKKHIRVNK
jgi:hypothetical protein